MCTVAVCGICGNADLHIYEAEVTLNTLEVSTLVFKNIGFQYPQGIPFWLGFHPTCADQYEREGKLSITVAPWRNREDYIRKRYG